MSVIARIYRALLILLSLPGILVTIYAGASTASLLWAELFPDPDDIAHGMAMAHAFIPMIVWDAAGIGYLLILWLLWLLTGKLCGKDRRST